MTYGDLAIKFKETKDLIKSLSLNVQTAIDEDLIDDVKKDIGKIYKHMPQAEIPPELIFEGSLHETENYAFIEDDYNTFRGECSRGRRVLIGLHTWPDVLSSHCLLSNMLITALYVPEELEWLEIYYCGQEEIDDDFPQHPELIGYFNNQSLLRAFGYSSESIEKLEDILNGSKDFSFLEEKGVSSLERILENSKKGLILQDHGGGKTIEMYGKKYKRLVVIYPAIPVIDSDPYSEIEPYIAFKLFANSEKNSETKSDCRFYVEGIKLRKGKLESLRKWEFVCLAGSKEGENYLSFKNGRCKILGAADIERRRC